MSKAMEDIKSIAMYGNEHHMTYAEVVKEISDGRLTLEFVIDRSSYKQDITEYEDEYLIPPDRLGICPTCGNRFEKERRTQRFCSSYCYYEHQAKKRAEKEQKLPTERKCAYCGKTFISTEVRRRKYCSERCAFMGKDIVLEEYRNRKAREHNGEA